MAVHVFTPTFENPEIIHQPQEVYRIGGFKGGLEIVPNHFGQVSIREILGLAVFDSQEDGRQTTYLMLVLRDRPRPIYIDMPRIAFTDFPVLKDVGTAADKLRKLTKGICRSAERIVIDQGTANFLRGEPVELLEHKMFDFASDLARTATAPG